MRFLLVGALALVTIGALVALIVLWEQQPTEAGEMPGSTTERDVVSASMSAGLGGAASAGSEPLVLPSRDQKYGLTSARVVGRLVDGNSREPLVGGKLTFWVSFDEAVTWVVGGRARTGDDGRFNLARPEGTGREGAFTMLVARVPGYPAAGRGYVIADIRDWRIRRGEVVIARVVDDQGRGIPGLNVSAEVLAPHLLLDRWPRLEAPVRWGSSFFRDLYRVEATGSDGVVRLRVETLRPMFSVPIVITARDGRDGALWAGIFERPLPQELVVSWPARAPLEGSVRSGQGPVVGARLTLLLRQESGQLLDTGMVVTTDAEGRFILPSLAMQGRCLGVLARGWATQLVELNGASSPLDIRMTPAREAQLVVVNEDGLVLVESTVLLRQLNDFQVRDGSRVGFNGDDARDLNATDPAWVAVQEPGRFTLKLGDEPPFIAEVSCPGYATTRLTEVVPGLHTVVLDRGSTLRGVVRRRGTEARLAGASVWLSKEPSAGLVAQLPRQQLRSVMKRLIESPPTGEDGRFELRGVPVGSYVLMAADATSSITRTHVKFTGREDVLERDLELSLPAFLSVTVRSQDPARTPPFGLRLLPLDESADPDPDGFEIRALDRTGSSGRFSFEEQEEGGYRLEVFTLSPAEKEGPLLPDGKLMSFQAELADARDVFLGGGAASDVLVELTASNPGGCHLTGQLTGRRPGFRYVASWSKPPRGIRSVEVGTDGSFDLGFAAAMIGKLRAEVLQMTDSGLVHSRVLVSRRLSLMDSNAHQEVLELPVHARIGVRLVDRRTGKDVIGSVRSRAPGASPRVSTTRVEGTGAELFVIGAEQHVMAQAAGYWFQSREVDLTGVDEVTLTFELEACSVWKALLVTPDEVPLAGATLIRATREDGTRIRLAEPRVADAQGHIRIPGLPPGTYTLTLHQGSNAYACEVDAEQRRASILVAQHARVTVRPYLMPSRLAR